MYTCVYVCVYMHTCVYIHFTVFEWFPFIYLHMSIHAHVYICVYMCVYPFYRFLMIFSLLKLNVFISHSRGGLILYKNHHNTFWIWDPSMSLSVGLSLSLITVCIFHNWRGLNMQKNHHNAFWIWVHYPISLKQNWEKSCLVFIQKAFASFLAWARSRSRPRRCFFFVEVSHSGITSHFSVQLISCAGSTDFDRNYRERWARFWF